MACSVLESIEIQCWIPISVMALYCVFSEIIEYFVDGGGGKFFLRSNFFRRNFIHLYTPFFGKTCPLTLESHIHVKALKMQGFSNN